MNRDKIKAIAFSCGFTIKEGLDDLKPYVYDFAENLLAEQAKGQAAPVLAGGDAVPLFWLSSQQVYGLDQITGVYLPFQREPGGNFDFPVFDRKPVAEAAAQADNYCDACEQHVTGPCNSVDCATPDAAPTAQPTPPDDERAMGG